jgi:glycosyltransferase involved in cell wall biosynthesis
MSKKIGILAEQFFTINNPDKILMGGGERWLIDFITVLKKMGYETECYQFSKAPWQKKYRHHTIKGLGNISGIQNNWQKDFINGINRFYELTQKCDGMFLLSMNLSVYPMKKPVLTVSHGLMFDGCMPGDIQRPVDTLEAYKKWIRNASYTISVDTNSIKVMQVYDQRVSYKMEYVPNYVDLNVFKPVEKLDKSRFTVLYPRRLQWCRGYTATMECADILLEKYKDIEFVFCGRGNEMEERDFLQWKNTKDDRVKYMWYDMPDMYKAYQIADISLVPTIMAEGTSLSCLESIASGVPPIVTHVGGLTDLVLKDVNGLMIPPNNVKELTSAIEYLYNNRSEIEKLKENGLKMISAFSKERWEKDIANVVLGIYGEP